MHKRYYKTISEKEELKSISLASSGTSGKIYRITEKEYFLSLCALGLMSGIIPADEILNVVSAV